jgi:hypothetical protein
MKTLFKTFLLLTFLAGTILQIKAAKAYDLYANDGTYLGKVTDNEYDPNSINNPYGKYGSEYSQSSVNNPYSKYGSEYSPYSPNNPYAAPARINSMPTYNYQDWK